MRRVYAALLLAVCCATTLAQMHEVAPEFWDRPRTGAALLEQESVKRAVSAALAQPEAQLVIHHAGAPELQLQAEELRAWLGALAIDTRRIVLRNDLGAGAAVKIEVVP